MIAREDARRFLRRVPLGGRIEATLVTLARGVVLFNSHSRTVMGTKIDKLTEHVEKHICLVELVYRPERDMAVIRRNIEPLYERMSR